MADAGAIGEARQDAATRRRAYRLDLEFVWSVPIALLLLLFVLPLLVAVAVAIFFDDGGPIVFVQRRIGRGGRTFPCYKFRSMAVDAEQRLQRVLDTDADARFQWEQDHKLKADPRVTRLGGFLRRSSLDELPQLLNVVRGHMCLVGPRPIVQAEVCRYGRYAASYFSVRPGLTGLWQVSGRNDVSYRRRIAMDVLYARTKSFALDAQILARTIPAVLSKRGSY
jgi:exopolysaccharide production protein ExoY